MDTAALIQTIAISALPVIFAITLHEAAHGYAARHFGDNTAWLAGRISLNPLRHIDPFGTVLLPLLLFVVNSPFIFGWAKPVPVNFGRLRNPKRDMLWVAAAGPAVNLLMAFGWAVLLKLKSQAELALIGPVQPPTYMPNQAVPQTCCVNCVVGSGVPRCPAPGQPPLQPQSQGQLQGSE